MQISLNWEENFGYNKSYSRVRWWNPRKSQTPNMTQNVTSDEKTSHTKFWTDPTTFYFNSPLIKSPRGGFNSIRRRSTSSWSPTHLSYPQPLRRGRCTSTTVPLSVSHHQFLSIYGPVPSKYLCSLSLPSKLSSFLPWSHLGKHLRLEPLPPIHSSSPPWTLTLPVIRLDLAALPRSSNSTYYKHNQSHHR